MIQRLCPQCRNAVRFEDENTLVYCGTCGLPQVRLSLELQAQAETQFAAPQSTPATRPDRPDPAVIAWKSMMRYAAAVSAVFTVFVFLLPPMALFTAPVVIGLYAGRHPAAQITTRIGVRVGLLCGLISGIGIAVLQTLLFLAMRYGTRGTAAAGLDRSLDAVFTHTGDQMAALYGQSVASQAAPLLSVPEYRVGLFLSGIVLYGIVLLLLGMVGGAFAGYWRSRPRHSA